MRTAAGRNRGTSASMSGGMELTSNNMLTYTLTYATCEERGGRGGRGLVHRSFISW
jgi:hypothetical protein